MSRNSMDWHDWDEKEQALRNVHRRLVTRRGLAPLNFRSTDVARWTDWELASLAENRLGELHHDDRLDDVTRERWRNTALHPLEPWANLSRRRKYEAFYWIQQDGRQVGMLSVCRFCLGDLVEICSVYVRPACRGMGFLSAALDAVGQELGACGLAIRLHTEWTWQQALRAYLRNGFWLRSWKRNLELGRYGPRPCIFVGESEATVGVAVGDRTAVLARARRDGERLLQHEQEPDVPHELQYLAPEALTTLALAIACAGWPLIRAGRQHDALRYSDLLHPEALAFRIQEWEAWQNHNGWRCETPRIPGLRYPTWAELEEGED